MQGFPRSKYHVCTLLITSAAADLTCMTDDLLKKWSDDEISLRLVRSVGRTDGPRIKIKKGSLRRARGRVAFAIGTNENSGPVDDEAIKTNQAPPPGP